MACLLLGILPFFEDLAFDAGLDILCPPAGGSPTQKYISFQAFSNLMYDTVNYLTKHNRHLDNELFTKCNEAVHKYLNFILHLPKSVSEVAVKHKMCYQAKKYVCMPAIRTFFNSRQRFLSKTELDIIELSINNYLVKVLLKADKMKSKYVRIEKAKTFVLETL